MLTEKDMLREELAKLKRREAEIEKALAVPTPPNGWRSCENDPPARCVTVQMCYRNGNRKLLTSAFIRHDGEWRTDALSRAKTCDEGIIVGTPLFWRELHADPCAEPELPWIPAREWSRPGQSTVLAKFRRNNGTEYCANAWKGDAGVWHFDSISGGHPAIHDEFVAVLDVTKL